MKEKILEDFKIKKKTFNAFKDRMINLLKDLIETDGIVAHQITGRTKETNSLSKKIDKKGEKYNTLNDITDVVGLRVVTYLESDVDPVAAIIEREFEKDEKNSIDKRILKSDQFGYRSLHVVVSLNDKRIKLPEYASYKSIKCEIQIRSILQHAWAEIEHDLGYKGSDIPDDYKRSFNRVAALLEVADIEFVKLKNQLTTYEKEVSKLIEERPEDVDLNKASLKSFVQTNRVIKDLRELVTKESGHQMRSGEVGDFDIKILKYCGIETIKSLETSLDLNKVGLFKFVKIFLNDRQVDEALSESVLLMYFAHYLISKQNDVSVIQKYFETFNFRRDNNLAQVYLDIFKTSEDSEI